MSWLNLPVLITDCNVGYEFKINDLYGEGNLKLALKEARNTDYNLSHFEYPREMKRTCEADPAGENSSFIFTVCVKSVPPYHLKLAYVWL